MICLFPNRPQKLLYCFIVTSLRTREFIDGTPSISVFGELAPSPMSIACSRPYAALFLFVLRQSSWSHDLHFPCKMPLYQMLCITAHYTEYVRTNVASTNFKPKCSALETYQGVGSSNGHSCDEREGCRSQHQLMGNTYSTPTDEKTWRDSFDGRVRSVFPSSLTHN